MMLNQLTGESEYDASATKESLIASMVSVMLEDDAYIREFKRKNGVKVLYEVAIIPWKDNIVAV